jgi:hypothetical protein
LRIAGFGLSDALDSAEFPIGSDEVRPSKFLHIHVDTDLSDAITKLQGKFRQVTDGATGNPSDDQNLGDSRKLGGGQFEFVLDHDRLEEHATYLIRVADAFTGDTKCLASSLIKTKSY